MKDADNVLEHLLFHKSLIYEDEKGERINRYMDMVKSLKNEYSAVKNGFDREIMVVFELVKEHHLDPWDIDLSRFSKEYLKRVRKEKNVNLSTAGYIILMAWTILKLQSDKTLESVHEEEEEEFSWDAIPDWFAENGEYDYTTTVLKGSPPIEERIRRKGERKVTLFELVEAFNEVKKTIKIREIINENRRKQRITDEGNNLENINKKMYKEETEKDMETVWNKICRFDGEAIPLSDLHNGDRDEFIGTIISVLFLASNEKIRVWQKRFPYGEIYVKRCAT